MRRAHAFALVAALTLSPPWHADAQDRDAPDPALLQRLHSYAARFVEAMSSVVARETYEQRLTARQAVPQKRRLLSDVLMLRPSPDALSVWFRDVFEVDGRAVNDRQERLLALLERKAPNALQEARRIADESARFNLGRVRRTINVPDLAFAYLLAPPAHLEVRAARDDRIDGQPVRVLRFREVGRPTIVRTPQGRDTPASGRLWVQAESGAVVRTEVFLGETRWNVRTTVDFAADPRIAVLVPAKMTEEYEAPGEFVFGSATYGDVRVFNVTTSEQVRKPPPSVRSSGGYSPHLVR